MGGKTIMNHCIDYCVSSYAVHLATYALWSLDDIQHLPVLHGTVHLTIP